MLCMSAGLCAAQKYAYFPSPCVAGRVQRLGTSPHIVHLWCGIAIMPAILCRSHTSAALPGTPCVARLPHRMHRSGPPGLAAAGLQCAAAGLQCAAGAPGLCGAAADIIISFQWGAQCPARLSSGRYVPVVMALLKHVGCRPKPGSAAFSFMCTWHSRREPSVAGVRYAPLRLHRSHLL